MRLSLRGLHECTNVASTKLDVMARGLPLFLATVAALAAQGNQPDRLEWFRDQGFGLFIHWSVDSQLGTVISHSLAGASDVYTRRFFTDLPHTYTPRNIHA